MPAVISLQSVAKRINGKTIIADCDLGLEKNQTLSIVGVNGCGKSILLKIIAGIINVDSGKIFIDGNSLTRESVKVRRKICYIPDYIDFDCNLNVYQNLYVYLKLVSKKTSNEIKHNIYHWSNILGFSHILYSMISEVEYSKLRLIQISRALASSPEYLLIDKPSFGLDSENKKWLWSLINTTLKYSTIVYTSYDFNEVESYSDRIAFLDKGKIRLNGTIKDIMIKTKSYGYYKLIFKSNISKKFSSEVRLNDNLYHVRIKRNEMEFYCSDKKTFFDIFKNSLTHDLLDMQNRPFNFEDVFLSQTRKYNDE